MTQPITPVVPCGGMGSRLWPLSRQDQPKQFRPTQGKGSLTYFQATVQRHRNDSFGEPIVVTNARQAALVHRQRDEVQLQGRIIGEPVGRNTGPAGLAAAICAHREDPDAVLLILPSDHVIKGDINRIITALRPAAEDGRIVTFGVTPTDPETGLRVCPETDHRGGACRASGISLMRADTLIEEYRHFDSATHAAEIRALGLMLEEASFRAAANEPTERQVFEHTIAIALAPLHGVQWDDVGAWNAGYQISDRDGDGNVLHGDVIAMDTKNSLIQSQGRLVAVIGMQDTIVIDTPDAVLVAHRSHAQSVKQLVERLKAAKRSEVASQTAHDTPWGRIETIASDAAQDMRIMTVHPGASLSVNGTGVGPSLLTVISGEGHCTIGGKVVTARRGQSVALDAGHALPLSNRTPRDLTLIHLVFRSGSDASEPLHDAFPGAATIDAPLFPQVVL